MMYPTRIPRQTAGGNGASGNPGRFLNNQPGRNNMVLGAAALVALTGIAYWWGYNDVDKRHNSVKRDASKNFEGLKSSGQKQG